MQRVEETELRNADRTVGVQQLLMMLKLVSSLVPGNNKLPREARKHTNMKIAIFFVANKNIDNANVEWIRLLLWRLLLLILLLLFKKVIVIVIVIMN